MLPAISSFSPAATVVDDRRRPQFTDGVSSSTHPPRQNNSLHANTDNLVGRAVSSYFAPGAVRSTVMSMSVCLSVCLSVCMSPRITLTSPDFLCMLTVALTAPCKDELCGCVLWGIRWTHVSPTGGNLAGNRRE